MWSCAACTFRSSDDSELLCSICGSERVDVKLERVKSEGVKTERSSAAAASSPATAAAADSRKRVRSICSVDSDDDDDAEARPVASPHKPPTQTQRRPVYSISAPSRTTPASVGIVELSDDEEEERWVAAPRRPAAHVVSPPSPVEDAPMTASQLRRTQSAQSKAEAKAEAKAAAAEAKALAKEAAAEAKAAAKEAKLAAKAQLKHDKELSKIVERACKGNNAEEEIHLVLHDDLRFGRFARLATDLTQGKVSHSFVSTNAASSSAAAASAAASSAAAASFAATATSSAAPFSLCSRIPCSIVFHRRQAPSVVAQVRARKRLRGAPPMKWKTLAGEEEARVRNEAADQRQPLRGGFHAVDELPTPRPILTVASIVDGEQFLALHNTQRLMPTLRGWLDTCKRENNSNTLLLVVHGVYRLVQMESNRSLQGGRVLDNGYAAAAAAKPLKKLTKVDALLAKVWFETKGAIRFKMLDNLSECLEWVVSLSSVLAKAPYKEIDTVLTLVNTNRTNRMRGGDDFSAPRVSPDSDDSDDDAAAAGTSSLQKRRAAAKASLNESWRLYVMQIPRMSERIALAVTRAYPSFRRLWDAYAACTTDKQRSSLVENLSVSGAAAPAGRVTRVGPALSNALYQSIWLQSDNPQLLAATAEADEEGDDVDADAQMLDRDLSP